MLTLRLKWKPPQEITLDFRLKLNNEHPLPAEIQGGYTAGTVRPVVLQTWAGDDLYEDFASISLSAAEYEK